MKNLIEEMYPNRVFLFVDEVCGLFGFSSSTLFRQEKRGDFPPRQKVSTRRVGYRKDLVIKVLEGKWKGGSK